MILKGIPQQPDCRLLDISRKVVSAEIFVWKLPVKLFIFFSTHSFNLNLKKCNQSVISHNILFTLFLWNFEKKIKRGLGHLCHSAIVCISPCIRLFKRCRFCLYMLNDITKYESGPHLLQIVTLKTQSLHRDTAKRIYVKYLLRIMANVLPTQFYGKICPLYSLCSKLKKNIPSCVSPKLSYD